MPSPNGIAEMLPLRANPLRVAEEIAMPDVVTRGRVISGFVRGIGCEILSLDLDLIFSREKFYEEHDFLVRAWTQPGPFEHLCRHYQYRYVNIWPRPYSKPYPSI